MAERAKHDNPKDKGKFSQGKGEVPKKSPPKPKDTAKTREAKRASGGRSR